MCAIKDVKYHKYLCMEWISQQQGFLALGDSQFM